MMNIKELTFGKNLKTWGLESSKMYYKHENKLADYHDHILRVDENPEIYLESELETLRRKKYADEAKKRKMHNRRPSLNWRINVRNHFYRRKDIFHIFVLRKSFSGAVSNRTKHGQLRVQPSSCQTEGYCPKCFCHQWAGSRIWRQRMRCKDSPRVFQPHSLTILWGCGIKHDLNVHVSLTRGCDGHEQ